MTTAIAQVVISTIVEEQATTESIVRHLNHDTRIAWQRAEAIRKLGQLGWELLRQPEGVNTGTDYVDVFAYWRKDFETSEQAESDLALAGALVDLNFSLGWDYTGDDDERGMPNCEWWSEAPGKDYVVEHFASSELGD
jgi:hypothetical protein